MTADIAVVERVRRMPRPPDHRLPQLAVLCGPLGRGSHWAAPGGAFKTFQEAPGNGLGQRSAVLRLPSLSAPPAVSCHQLPVLPRLCKLVPYSGLLLTEHSSDSAQAWLSRAWMAAVAGLPLPVQTHTSGQRWSRASCACRVCGPSGALGLYRLI